MDKYDETRAAVAALLERSGIKYTAMFVPQSASRNWSPTFSRCRT